MAPGKYEPISISMHMDVAIGLNRLGRFIKLGIGVTYALKAVADRCRLNETRALFQSMLDHLHKGLRLSDIAARHVFLESLSQNCPPERTPLGFKKGLLPASAWDVLKALDARGEAAEGCLAAAAICRNTARRASASYVLFCTLTFLFFTFGRNEPDLTGAFVSTFGILFVGVTALGLDAFKALLGRWPLLPAPPSSTPETPGESLMNPVPAS